MLFENLLVSYSGVSRCYWTVSSKFKEKNWTSKLKAKKFRLKLGGPRFSVYCTRNCPITTLSSAI